MTKRQVACRVLSLGAGVQSTVLALMMTAQRRIPPVLERCGYCRPDFAIFADTGWEPRSVYRHLDWLRSELSFRFTESPAGTSRET